MRLIKSKTRIDFLGQRYIAFVISAILVAVSLGSFAIQGMALGIEFTGGVVVEVGYDEPANLEKIRNVLVDSGYPDATAQYFGSQTEVMIRLGPQKGKDTAAVSSSIMNALHSVNPNVEMRRVQFVGSQVGDELFTQGGLALLFTIIAILIYVMIRFHWKMAAGAVAALAHNIIITAGFFSVFQWNFDLTVLAALLAILGYGVNDTIVVFDRVRENFRRMRKVDAFTVMNTSINEMLSRTIMTSLTVVLAVLALLIFGGEAIHGFSLAMLIGTLCGVYSTMYVAMATALHLDVTKEDIYPPREEEDAERDG